MIRAVNDLCGICDKPITGVDKQDPQGPQFIVKDGKRLPVHVDCYFNGAGRALEEYPIALGVRRRA